MAESSKNWYVLIAISGKELKVKEYIEAEMKHIDYLNAHITQVLVPVEKHPITRAGKRVVQEKVSLAGYVFLETDVRGGEVARMVRFMPNVLGFLGGMDKPSPVPQRDINRMLGTVEETEVEDDVTIPYEVNEVVKITDGPFSGFNGNIEEIYPEKRKLKVMVKIFGGQNPLELSFTQVEKEG